MPLKLVFYIKWIETIVNLKEKNFISNSCEWKDKSRGK